MEKLFTRRLKRISKESAFVCLTLAAAILLPQALHLIGIRLGVGGALGQIFLPMYLPVLILGFYRGAVPGAIVGLLAPLISFALTGMPQEALLPYITLELIATGSLAGVFAGFRRLPAVLSVLCVQVLARAVRLAALLASICATGGSLSSLFAGIFTSIPGVLLQLALMSLLLMGRERKK